MPLFVGKPSLKISSCSAGSNNRMLSPCGMHTLKLVRSASLQVICSSLFLVLNLFLLPWQAARKIGMNPIVLKYKRSDDLFEFTGKYLGGEHSRLADRSSHLPRVRYSSNPNQQINRRAQRPRIHITAQGQGSVPDAENGRHFPSVGSTVTKFSNQTANEPPDKVGFVPCCA